MRYGALNRRNRAFLAEKLVEFLAEEQEIALEDEEIMQMNQC